MVATGMTSGHGIPVSESVDNLISRIESATIENTGKFFHANGTFLCILFSRFTVEIYFYLIHYTYLIYINIGEELPW